MLVVIRLHLADALLGRAHNGAEGINLQPRVVLFQPFQPGYLVLQVLLQMVMGAGCHQTAVVQAVRGNDRGFCMGCFLF